jgi:hypothetical protein
LSDRIPNPIHCIHIDPWKVLLFSDSGDHVRCRRVRRFDKVARREIAAPQVVILKERLPFAANEGPKSA